MPAPPAEFPGTKRYRILNRIGAGGMGVVYRALDTLKDRIVALKVLTDPDPAAIGRFKDEFRVLQEVTHPNLVVLYELHSEDGFWFFTMELVDGPDFLEYVRPGIHALRPSGNEPTLPSPQAAAQAREQPARVVQANLPPLDHARLRTALRMLAEGVHAVHAASLLHRDLKPNNVLVDPSGVVKLVDFGLATSLDPGDSMSSSRGISGTFAYMSPEQANGDRNGPPTDWYAVGVMLYEALTGRHPYAGGPLQVLMDKQRVDPPPPSAIAREVPDELERLCLELLQRDPSKRPSGAEVLRRLGGSSAQSIAHAVAPKPRANGHGFVGRTAQLALLDEAYAKTRAGGATAVFVRGGSGMGKTALVRRFLETVEAEPEAMVLSGRCYERELVPYKAVDSLIDSLTRKLVQLPKHQVEALLPRDVLALARVFPVLRRIDAVGNAPRRIPQAPDPQELRRRAFAGLRELFERTSARVPVVLFVDDLQWGDVDSAALLSELLRPPDPPTVLLVGCYRAEDEPAVAPLVTLLRDSAVDVQTIELGMLEEREAQELATSLLSSADPSAAAEAAAIAKESGGSPFFLDVLARHVQSAAVDSAPRAISLADVLGAQCARLPDPARRLLEFIALAGQPLPIERVAAAAGLGSDLSASVATLRSQRLIRSSARGEGDAIECFHDRVREHVAGALSAEDARRVHGGLARALEGAPGVDPEFLARHHAGAGDYLRAGAAAAQAASRAAEALAFDRAAALYRQALEWLPPDDARRRDLTIRMGEAFANAGRGRDAARAFLDASRDPSPRPLLAAELLELQRRAAEQLLSTGHVDEGVQVLTQVLADEDLRLARSPRTALASLAWRRLRVRLRGLSFKERDTSQLSAELLSRIDTCWVAALGLGFVDPIRGADFQAKHLLLALEAGEPYRVARAFAADACFASMAGTRSTRRTERLVQTARGIAERLDDPHALALTNLAEGLSHFLAGRWRQAIVATGECERLLRDRGMGARFERVNAQLVTLWCLFYLGEFDEFRRRVPLLRQEALERGDLYGTTSSGITNVAFLVTDEPGRARDELEHAIGQWSTRGFLMQHYWSLLAQGLADSYVGNVRAVWERTQAAWPHLQRSLLLRLQLVRLEARHIRAHAALGVAASGGPDVPGLLAQAEQDAARMAQENTAYGRGLSALVRASIADARGNKVQAAALYLEADRALTEAEVHAFAAAARWRRGELVGGDEGRALVTAAEAFLRGKGVKNPERLARMMVQRFG